MGRTRIGGAATAGVMMGRILDRTGARYGRLMAIRLVSTKPTKWLCHCDCGAETIADGGHLGYGDITSCGCYQREFSHRRHLKHGATVGGHTAEYRTWSAMRRRCEEPTNEDYPHYGGRGITVCERWADF